MAPNFKNSMSVEQRYRFDTYYTGLNNENAIKLLRGLVDKSGAQGVFINGPSACGKTHLLYAIKNEIHDAYPDQKTRLTAIPPEIIAEYNEPKSERKETKNHVQNI